MLGKRGCVCFGIYLCAPGQVLAGVESVCNGIAQPWQVGAVDLHVSHIDSVAGRDGGASYLDRVSFGLYLFVLERCALPFVDVHSNWIALAFYPYYLLDGFRSHIGRTR